MATKPEKPKISINLSSRGKTTVGVVFYRWAVDAGRGIIVGIELIALLALGYRFMVDRKIVDLHDEIAQQEAFIAAQTRDEIKYRGIQDRLKNIKITNENTTAKVRVMNEVLDSISAGTFFNTNLTINQQAIAIEGSTFSIYTLTGFVDSVKKLPQVASISIDEINTTDDGVKFKVRINVLQEKGAEGVSS